MRSLAIALCALIATAAGAQDRDVRIERSGLPRDVAREAARLFNESSVTRSSGRMEIEEDRIIEGDLAVLNGPVFISGRVKGRVLAINSDVVLKPSARIDGDLLVVGGEVEGRHAAYVGGEIRIYRQQMQYVREGDFIRPERETTLASDESGWWRRWDRAQHRSDSKLFVAAGVYNRIEGLPITIGPQIYHSSDWGSAKVDAHAIVRTETSFNGQQDDIGHNVNVEVKFGRRGGLMLGGRAYNSLEPTESWQLGKSEASLSAFVLRRDYRDYYERRGGQARAGLFLRRGADVSVSYSDENWMPRGAESPWTLFKRKTAWRPNPIFDQGVMKILNTTLRIDSRNDNSSPWSGWFVSADLEHGNGTMLASGPRSAPLVAPTPGDVQYARAFLDFRRYNRVSPDAQLNFRVVTGGWVNGDALPLQRRFAVDGPGGLPGYDFRTQTALNMLTCSSGAYAPGVPGQCDRMALAQVEYRGDLHFDLFTDWEDDHYMRSHTDGVWVFFADAGRGWLVGQPSAGDELTFARDEMPKLSTFKTDLGIGLDFDLFGLYVAKAMSQPKEPANFFVRIRHRF